MRKPKVKNKYNLTMKKINNLKIGDESKICEPLFWRNNIVGAYGRNSGILNKKIICNISVGRNVRRL